MRGGEDNRNLGLGDLFSSEASPGARPFDASNKVRQLNLLA
jgi:hypothetical protein